MDGFFLHLVQRAGGDAPLAQPLLPPMYAPLSGPGSFDGAEIDDVVEPVATPPDGPWSQPVATPAEHVSRPAIERGVPATVVDRRDREATEPPSELLLVPSWSLGRAPAAHQPEPNPEPGAETPRSRRRPNGMVRPSTPPSNSDTPEVEAEPAAAARGWSPPPFPRRAHRVTSPQAAEGVARPSMEHVLAFSESGADVSRVPSERDTGPGTRVRERSVPQDGPPTIRVSIGRIEVRAVQPPVPSRRSPQVPAAPRLSLDEYLRARNEGQR
jgi:hypothetical protein